MVSFGPAPDLKPEVILASENEPRDAECPRCGAPGTETELRPDGGNRCRFCKRPVGGVTVGGSPLVAPGKPVFG